MYYQQFGTISQNGEDNLENYGDIRGSTCTTHVPNYEKDLKYNDI